MKLKRLLAEENEWKYPNFVKVDNRLRELVEKPFDDFTELENKEYQELVDLWCDLAKNYIEKEMGKVD